MAKNRLVTLPGHFAHPVRVDSVEEIGAGFFLLKVRDSSGHPDETQVTAEELEYRKANLVGSFKVSLATTDGLSQSLLLAIERGKDVSWLDEYPGVIGSLTVDQVNGAVKKHLDPEKMHLIKAGTVPGVPPAADGKN